MKKRKIFEKGFTLVELLIVIALIAILSVAVLATINPIEQTNKARDAKFRNDAAEILAALERYYASQSSYPWNTGTGTTVSFGQEVAIASNETSFGVADVENNDTGVLITTSELKSSFSGKEPFALGVTPIDTMYIYHNGSDSNYVCYVPKAKANRYLGANPNPNLKCLTLGYGSEAELLDQGGGCVAPDPWSDLSLTPVNTVANVLCVPEGEIAEASSVAP